MRVQLEIDGRSAVWQGQPKPLGEILAEAGLPLGQPCGGRGRCGKCRLRIIPPPPPTDRERELLSDEALAEGIRLACLTTLTEDCTVTRLSGEAEIETEGGSEYTAVCRYTRVSGVLSPATLQDSRSRELRLEALFGLPTAPEALEALTELPLSGGEVTALTDGQRILHCYTGAPQRLYGCGVDIGTTTVVAYLMDLETGEQAAVASALNPQSAKGADVISRLEAAAQPGGLEVLSTLIRQCLRELLEECCRKAAVSSRQIVDTVITGNTVMLHLAAGISPNGMAASPFIPAFLTALELRPGDWGLPMLPAGRLRLMPSPAAFVGGDITASVMASGMDRGEDLCLMVDIGTNGEMVLGNRDKLLACSTAAGPALEGAHIRCGMGGVTGAVCGVTEDLSLRVIGEGTPLGICGSGLVDAVAVLLHRGALDETGRLQPEEAPAEWENRWSREGRNALLTLSEGVVLCQQDIREVQLAKAAIAAGIGVLVSAWGAKVTDIQQVYIAGGFGSRLNKASACAIGLLPAALRERITVIGNGAGTGARMSLLDPAQEARANGLARRIEVLELSASSAFQELFVDEMVFA